MGYYLVTLNPAVHLARLDTDGLKAFQSGIKALEAKGTCKGAYSKVGGGIVLILDTDLAKLTSELRKHFITDADVVPLVPLDAEVTGYLDYMSKNQAKRTQFAAKHSA